MTACDEQALRALVATTSPGCESRVLPGFSPLMEQNGTLFHPAAALVTVWHDPYDHDTDGDGHIAKLPATGKHRWMR